MADMENASKIKKKINDMRRKINNFQFTESDVKQTFG